MRPPLLPSTLDMVFLLLQVITLVSHVSQIVVAVDSNVLIAEQQTNLLKSFAYSSEPQTRE
jgi:hypothetical protein